MPIALHVMPDSKRTRSGPEEVSRRSTRRCASSSIDLDEELRRRARADGDAAILLSHEHRIGRGVARFDLDALTRLQIVALDEPQERRILIGDPRHPQRRADRAGEQAVEVAGGDRRLRGSESDRRADRGSDVRASRRSARSAARTPRVRAARLRRGLRPSSCPSPARETARPAGDAAARGPRASRRRRVRRTPLYGSYSARPDSASALTIVVAVPGVTPSAAAT